MSSPHFMLVFIIGSLFSIVTNQGSKERLLPSIKQESLQLSATFPSNYLSYINNIQYSSTLTGDTIELTELPLLRTKYNIPVSVYDKLRLISYANDAIEKSFNKVIKVGSVKVEEYVGAAVKNGNNFDFLYFKTESHGTLVPKYETISYKKCKKILLLFKSCKTITEKVSRGLTSSELDLVERTLRAFAYKSLSERLSAVNSDTQFVLSSGSEIYSLSMKKTVTITNTGQLYIDDPFTIYKLPSTKLLPLPSYNAGLLPIKPLPTLNTTSTLLIPRKETAIENALIVNRLHSTTSKTSANFILPLAPAADKLLFTKQDVANKPYSFIVKTSGNMQIANKDGKVVWQSYTTGKGVAPFSLILTEDGNFMLCDDNWKPVYDSNKVLANKVKVALPQEYRIYSANKKFYLTL